MSVKFDFIHQVRASSVNVMKTLACLMAFMSFEAISATSRIEGVGIYKLRVYTNGNFGNCTAGTSANFNTDGAVALSCTKTALVNFGCDGSGPHSKSEGAAMWSTAQLAFAMGKQIDIVVDDSHQPGGVCTATAIFTTGRNFP